VVIEQITYLMFIRLLDIHETLDETRSARTGRSFTKKFGDDEQKLRWSNFYNIGDPEELMVLVRDDVFKHFRRISQGSHFAAHMSDGRLEIQKTSLLRTAIEMVNSLPLENKDTQGDLYEYLLSKLTTSGINGQFRTPRHVIKLMVNMIDPKPGELVSDPACGTSGFLVAVIEYIREINTTEAGLIEKDETDDDGNITVRKIFSGDRLRPEQWKHIQSDMLHGFDFDNTMLRIAAMNLFMHGVADPKIINQDTLSQSFEEKYPELEHEAFDIVLANPPFKGQLDSDGLSPEIYRSVKTKKTELLFLARILRLLKEGGRCAVIVPDGVLFGASNAHASIRELIVEQNQLEAVVSLPNGVFKPYAGVSTAILFFTKGGNTDRVWFYDLQEDGYSRDDKRNALLSPDKLGVNPDTALSDEEHVKNNLPDVLARWKERENSEVDRPRTSQSFVVPKAEIAENKYDLSINRYKEPVYEEVEYDPPLVILDQLDALEKEIQDDLKELREML
jgi:type I restriction enzyme M protein